VQFWRHQKGATINTNFAGVATKERQPNSICISCIYWEEKGECYVTSVDCIYLLESLISVRFTVEEKNRIRRNLEGFRPMTVSKAKADSENFFKLIMAFPNPKPRNIEKDVKVFPWKILGMAMKKIIGKYSASYSSTTAALPQPPPQPYQTAPSNEPTVPAAESLPVTHPPRQMLYHLVLLHLRSLERQAHQPPPVVSQGIKGKDCEPRIPRYPTVTRAQRGSCCFLRLIDFSCLDPR